jgi:hypothetical protein
LLIERQFEKNCGTMAEAVAAQHRPNARFLCGRRASVQAEAVTVLARGDTAIENVPRILRRDADAIFD